MSKTKFFVKARKNDGDRWFISGPHDSQKEAIQILNIMKEYNTWLRHADVITIVERKYNE